MDDYVKTTTVNEDDEVVVPPFPAELVQNDVRRMVIKPNSRVKNTLAFVHRLFRGANEEQGDEPSKEEHSSLHPAACSSRVVFTGKGDACSKVISCVEVFKRQYRKVTLYQWTKVKFCRTEEFWDPRPGLEGVDRLKVNRDVPVIFVLISKDPFPGGGGSCLQDTASGPPDWLTTVRPQKSGNRKKRLPLAASGRNGASNDNRWKRKERERKRVKGEQTNKSDARVKSKPNIKEGDK